LRGPGAVFSKRAPGRRGQRERLEFFSFLDYNNLKAINYGLRNQVGINVLEDLQRKAAFIDHEGKELYFAIFAKKGFTGELEERAKSKKNILLYDFSRILPPGNLS
jgi:hypothetical protein